MPSFTLTRNRALVVAALALAVVLLAARLGGRPPSGSAASQVGEATTASLPTLTTAGPASLGSDPEAPDGTASVVVVDVSGAVRHPGLYRLPQGSRIADAVARAGGMTRAADRLLVNLAAPLADGEQILVPGRGGTGGAGGVPAGGPSPSAPVDLNTATVEQLDALPGIGPVTAQKIIDYRQQHGSFTSVDGLDAIPGIGPARIANLKGLVIA